jgi:hypothetical protein
MFAQMLSVPTFTAPKERPVTPRHFYRGYHFIQLSTLVGRDKYRSRVAVIDATASSTGAQRFLDFETFANQDAAQQRAFVGARAWIDAQLSKDEARATSRLAPL